MIMKYEWKSGISLSYSFILINLQHHDCDVNQNQIRNVHFDILACENVPQLWFLINEWTSQWITQHLNRQDAIFRAV